MATKKNAPVNADPEFKPNDPLKPEDTVPGGTQINNPTPDVRALDSHYFPTKQLEILEVEDGLFHYTFDRSDPVVTIANPDDRDISSALAIVFVGDNVPEGGFGAWHTDRANAIALTIPVDVNGATLTLRLPERLEEDLGREKARIAIIDNDRQLVAKSAPFQFQPS